MKNIVECIFNKINVILPVLAGIIGLIISIKTNFISKDKIIKNKYLQFKSIREEYSKDKINGYFALQQYFNARLSIEEMDYILESPDAYSIFPLLKVARGKYEFKDKNFVSKITKGKYVLPIITYIISFLFLSSQLVFAKELISKIQMYSFIILLIFNLCVCVPIFLNSLFSINEISSTLRLCKLTTKIEEKKQKTSNNKITEK